MRLVFVAVLSLPLTLAAHAALARNTSTHHVAITTSSAHATQDVKAKTVYHNIHGRPITAEAFNKAVKTGHHFSIELTADHKHAILTLLPKGATGGINFGNLPKLDVAIGGTLPAFRLPLLGGGHASPASLQGAPTLVDLFFAQCGACVEELPALNAYKASHPKMHFLAITFDGKKTAADFVAKRHFTWPVAYAGGTYLNKRLKVSSYPTLFLLDGNGHLRAMRTGSPPITTTSKVHGKAGSKSTISNSFEVESAAALDAHLAHSAQKGAANQKQQTAWLSHWVKQHLKQSAHGHAAP